MKKILCAHHSSLLHLGPTSPWPLRARALLVAPARPTGLVPFAESRQDRPGTSNPRWVDAQRLRPLVPFVSPGDASASPVAGATAETDSRMTTAPAPLLATLPRRRPRRRAPAARTTVVPLEGDLEARPRELEAELVARLCRDTTLVLDLRGATFLGAGAARLLLDLRSQAAAFGVRLVLWRPEGQPFRTLRIVRFDRVFELRPASWRPPRSRDWTVAQPERWVDVRAG